jgi:hypothetical protein
MNSGWVSENKYIRKETTLTYWITHKKIPTFPGHGQFAIACDVKKKADIFTQ